MMTMLDMQEKETMPIKTQDFSQLQMLDGILNQDTLSQSMLVKSIHTKEDKMSLSLKCSNKRITLNTLL